jgi:hypothetical protein
LQAAADFRSVHWVGIWDLRFRLLVQKVRRIWRSRLIAPQKAEVLTWLYDCSFSN